MDMDIKRLELIVTHRCSGQCIHCSDAPSRQGDIVLTKLDAARATALISDIASRYEPNTVLTTGGEPLLYADTVCAIHRAAYEEGIPERELITNGFFTKSPAKIRDVARKLVHAQLTRITVSVDAFHQAEIPLPTVRQFAEALLDAGFYDLAFQPTWLISPDDRNVYNRETRKILESLDDTGIEVLPGSAVIPAGGALENLSGFFAAADPVILPCSALPHGLGEDNRETLQVEPSGQVFACGRSVGSLRTGGILELLDNAQ